MTGRGELAVCGSNLTGDVPFSCALRLDGRMFVAQSPAGQRGDLATLVRTVCEQAAIAPGDLGAIRLDVGPGSYTGLRVAVTFVRVLQQFGGVAVHAIDSLALLAARAAVDRRQEVRALLDARRDRVHVQSFVVDGASVVATTDPAAVPLASVLTSQPPGGIVVVPANLPPLLAEPLRAAGASLRPAAGLVAAEMFAEGLPFTPADAAALEPRYLMASYAEQ